MRSRISAPPPSESDPLRISASIDTGSSGAVLSKNGTNMPVCALSP